MRDILIIFTVLLLLLITISTLGGSLTFVNKVGGTEYFTDMPTAKKADATKSTTPKDLAKFTQPGKTTPPLQKITPTLDVKGTASTAPKTVDTFVEGFEGPIYATA